MALIPIYTCPAIIKEIFCDLSVDVYSCKGDGTWGFEFSEYLVDLPKNASVIGCKYGYSTCPRGGLPRVKVFKSSEYITDTEKWVKLLLGFEEVHIGASTPESLITNENYVDVVVLGLLVYDKNTGALKSKKIDTIWGTGGNKVIVKYKGTPIFSVLADRVKNNITLW
jgi:hypothetical protein